MADDLSSVLAENLRELRRRRELSQQSLAEISGVPRPTLAHLESGVANPTLAVARRVASALGVSIDQLLEVRERTLRVTRRQQLSQVARRQCRVYELAGDELDVYRWQRWELKRGARCSLAGERSAQRYVVCCDTGEVEIKSGDRLAVLQVGDVAWVPSGQGAELHNVDPGSSVVQTLLTPLSSV